MAGFLGVLVGIATFTLLFPVFPADGADPYRALSVIRIARETAPDFSLKQVGGKSIKLSSYKDTLVLLGFFKTF